MTKIKDLLDAGPTRSFEFFPPKNDEMERQLDKAVAELTELSPSFVSVTYGALGSTRERTKDVVIRINHEQRFPCMAHLTCVGHTRADIATLLDEYAANGVENILALGGDPPADGSDPGGEFVYASELIEIVRAHPANFSIGVAAHPELHPRSPDRESDRRFLAAKLATADFGMTQFFFLADDYFRMVDELAALGCTTPVLPGIMPVLTVAGVRRMAAMNGTAIPADLDAQLDAADGAPDQVIDVGVETATALCQSMLDAGAPGIHLYALNRSESVRRIYANLGLAQPRVLLLHETHSVRGLQEDEFERHYRERWMTALTEGSDPDGARLLWYAHQAHGTGPAYRIITITVLRDGAAYGALVDRVQTGDLRAWARDLDGLQHDSVGKVLVPLTWSPLADLDLGTVPCDPNGAEHELTLYMEDTGWPHAPLDDYTGFWERVYLPMLHGSSDTRGGRPRLLEIEAVFQVAHGGGRRPEAILLQKVVSHEGLLRLLEHETPKEMKQPGTFMHDALQVRDQWESRLLRTSAWSPRY